VGDGRQQGKVLYPIEQLLWTGILMHATKLGARRQIKFQFDTPQCHQTLKRWLGFDDIAHGDTLNNCFMQAELACLEPIPGKMVGELIRSKAIDQFRLMGYYILIATDGTGVLSFDTQHCPDCLHVTQHGKTTWYHPVLEAKLVTRNGLALSVATEFIENTDPSDSKQDCELKAFYRLAPKIKAAFPRLPVCLLLDGLYAAAPVFKICQDFDWKFIITLKDKDLKSVNEEFLALREQMPENQKRHRRGEHNEIQQLSTWVSDIEYKTRETKNAPSFFLNVLECTDTYPDSSHKRFRWVTNIELNRGTAHRVGNQGGRLRWKIENEGFNEQKNGGFELEHAFSTNTTSAKCFYILLQLACTLLQLMFKTNLMSEQCRRTLGGVRRLSARLLEAFRCHSLRTDEIHNALHHRKRVSFIFR